MTEQLKEVNKDLSFQNIQIGEREVYEIEYVRQIIETIKNTYSLDPKNFAHGKGARKTQGQRFYEFFDTALGRLITYADKLEIIGENRGSYSKTDKDANIIHINYNLHKFNGLKKCDLLIDYVEKKYVKNKNNFIMIDEVQMCKEFERTINSLHAEEKYDIYNWFECFFIK